MSQTIERTFLPQYAAEAALDLMRQRKDASPKVSRILADAIRILVSAPHIILPDDGIYRSVNGISVRDQLGTITCDEAESMSILPAPIVVVQLRIDGIKHVFVVEDAKPLGIGLWALAFDKLDGSWIISRYRAGFDPQNLPYIDSGQWVHNFWAKHIVDNSVRPTGRDTTRLLQIYIPGFSLVAQMCHSLRAGATLERRRDLSSREKMFRRKGAGGFEYHVLTLPGGSGSGGVTRHGGTHASPRLHLRRAHIRKLPTGKFTLVRHCLVGDPKNGVVAKDYRIHAN